MDVTMNVYYEEDGETGQQIPVWILLHDAKGADWSKTLYVRLNGPFEAHGLDEWDEDLLALSVPDHVYVRHPKNQALVGLHLPTLRAYVERQTSIATEPIGILDIDRLLLRISDVEDVLQYNVRTLLPRHLAGER
ncbi:MAG: hypothetical protein K0Q63_1501 [Paenibacillus sp.]|jgi:hypothetical protein|nr:hypothetical protein [Paenibacillus sp.]